jgi:hypothetical protein
MSCDIAYVAQAASPGGMVKVGRSTNPVRRIAQIAQNAPFTLRPICFIDHGAKTESDLKQRLADSRVKGEWFEPTDDLVAALTEYDQQGLLVEQVAVDERYVAEEIEPRLRAYIASRSGALHKNAAGDIVYRILHGDPLCFVGREAALVTAVGGEAVPANVASGWKSASGFAELSFAPRPVLLPASGAA